MGPMRRENIVRLSSEQKVELFGKHLIHRHPHRLVEIGEGPAAELEAADRIFVRSAWRLHDSIEADKRPHDDLPHFRSPSSLAAWPAFLTRTPDGGECRQRPEEI